MYGTLTATVNGSYRLELGLIHNLGSATIRPAFDEVVLAIVVRGEDDRDTFAGKKSPHNPKLGVLYLFLPG